MKRLDKVLLMNWHYIVRQVMDVGQISFLTGKNGAGKSTILDALQLLILGDTAGHFFNKAANDNARRTLKGYLYGEVSEREEGDTEYLRGSKTFSSYIVAQFTDTVKDRAFCLGVVFDCDSNGEYTHRFFLLHDALPSFLFARDNIPLDVNSLRTWGSSLGKNKLEFFQSNKQYQEVLRSQMGNLGAKFFALFRKAVPFSPIMDVAGFISEFVTDVEHRLDIEDMRENIRHYRQLERELEYVKRKVDALQVLQHQFDTMETLESRVLANEFLLDRAKVTQQEERLREIETEVLKIGRRVQELADQLHRDDKRLEALSAQRDDWREERARSDVFLTQQRLEADLAKLETAFYPIRDALRRQERNLLQWHSSWSAINHDLSESGTWFTQDRETSLEGELQSVQEMLERAKKSIHSALTQLRHSVDIGDISLVQFDSERYVLNGDHVDNARGLFEQALEDLQQAHNIVQRQVGGWTDELNTLQQDIASLERGIIPYNQSIIRLQQAIASGLRAQVGSDVQVSVFAELLEVRGETWQRAIEGYLHTQRFNLIVPPEHFVAALEIYDRMKRDGQIYDVGLVDIGRILEESPRVEAGSLAQEIETDNPHARAYANHLLGRVMKAASVHELRRHRIAITEDGMLYQNYVARQLNPKRWASLFIGKRALEQQLATRRLRKAQVESQLRLWRKRMTKTAAWSRGTLPTSNEIQDLRDTQEQLTTVPDLQRHGASLVKQLGELDLSFVIDLDNKIRACDAKIQGVKEHRDIVVREEGQLKEVLLRLDETDRPRAKQTLVGLVTYLENTYTSHFRDEQDPRYQQELKRLGSAQQLIVNFGRQLEADKTRRDGVWQELVSQRSAYNRDFQAGFDIHRHDNVMYQQELQRLVDSQLTQYETSIRAAKERAQVQFQEDFVSKLQSNIFNVEQQIRDLNAALKGISFGSDQYRFQVSPDPQYLQFYQMIMDELLMEGFGLFSQSFQEKHGPVVEELFRNIVDVDESDPLAMTELEKNLEKFTDYRTYLNFDLIVKDSEGRESRLSRVISKKSGGETQTPFYISVLASFVQLYRIGRRGTDNTLRLIIFDEAYSKMDHQRIQESIKLIRDLGLQVILSAPTEKLADIAPMVDKTMVVTRLGSQTRVLEFNIDEQVVEV